MESRAPMRLDLNPLFQPVIKDGIAHLSDCELLFHDAHRAVMALKQTGQLAFSRIPEDDVLLDQVLEAASVYHELDNVVVCGIGGSALGASSLYHALRSPLFKTEKGPRLLVLDNIDPMLMRDTLRGISDQKNLFVLISKAGNTAETLAQYLFVTQALPRLTAKDFFIITGQRDSFLQRLSEEKGIARLPIPSGVGGRFSVFTPVGLFPLAVCGVDVAGLLEGARASEHQCVQGVLAQNQAALMATSLYLWLSQKKAAQTAINQIVMMPYCERLRLFSDWFAQLWAESLGKRCDLSGREVMGGSTPIKSIGVTDQHSQLQLYLDGPRDKVICFISAEDVCPGELAETPLADPRVDYLSNKNLADLFHAELAATEESLCEQGVPHFRLKLSVISEYQLGQLYQTFMNIIPYLGVLFHINAFDQPAVERIKKYTFGLMGRKGFEDFAEKIRGKARRKDLVF